MQVVTRIDVPARHARAVSLKAGQRLRVIDVEGQQVCDLFAFNPTNPKEFLSVSETRGVLKVLTPGVGDTLYSNLGRELLLWEEDTVGVHDSRAAACDLLRYWSYDVAGHRSCKANLLEALAELSLCAPVLPDPLNLFQNSVYESGQFEVLPPLSKPGDHVTFRALADLVAVGSACPMDMNACNGFNPTGLRFELSNQATDVRSPDLRSR